MRTRSSILWAAALLVLGGLAAKPSSAELLVNPSFESFSGGTVESAWPDRFRNVGIVGSSNLSVTGWNFDAGTVFGSPDIWRDSQAPGATHNAFQAFDGYYFAGGTTEGFTQTFLVAADTTYELRFRMAPGALFNHFLNG